MIDPYWRPNQIRFTKPQVKWLLGFIDDLRNGDYLRDPTETGYVDPATKQRHVSGKAKFLKAADIAAELDKRITNAKLDGLLMEFYYSADVEDLLFRAEHIAQCLAMPVSEVTKRIRNALFFVSGQRRKAGSYDAFVKGNQRYLKGRSKPTLPLPCW